MYHGGLATSLPTKGEGLEQCIYHGGLANLQVKFDLWSLIMTFEGIAITITTS